jgi:hypothetical protein
MLMALRALTETLMAPATQQLQQSLLKPLPAVQAWGLHCSCLLVQQRCSRNLLNSSQQGLLH